MGLGIRDSLARVVEKCRAAVVRERALIGVRVTLRAGEAKFGQVVERTDKAISEEKEKNSEDGAKTGH